jgi:Xaa-Pro aminopeptidase
MTERAIVVPGEAEIDFGRLRAERLERLQATMDAEGVAACLFFLPANIRYATGAAMMDVFCSATTVRYCVVPAEGPPILFEWAAGVPYSSRLVADVRPAEWWQFTGDRRSSLAEKMAREVRAALAEHGLAGEQIGADRADVLALLALQQAGIRLIDASPVTERAREVKTPEEVKLLRVNGRIGSEMMAEFEQAIVPGVAEFELFATLSSALLRRRGEVVFARLIASGQNTNPWGSEAWDKVVAPGEVVAVDTDSIGYEGYLIDFSRTFLCGDGAGARPSAEALEAYRVAYDALDAMREIIKPGMSYAEYARAVPAMPEKFLPLRYEVMVHGAGLEDEGPGIYHDGQGDNPEDAYIEENMALCLECYAGVVGGTCGVKLEDQVLVTSAGAEVLTEYPFDERLLGR